MNVRVELVLLCLFPLAGSQSLSLQRMVKLSLPSGQFCYLTISFLICTFIVFFLETQKNSSTFFCFCEKLVWAPLLAFCGSRLPRWSLKDTWAAWCRTYESCHRTGMVCLVISPHIQFEIWTLIYVPVWGARCMDSWCWCNHEKKCIPFHP